MAERILITGGAGFLGCALANKLRARARVVLFDKLCHDPKLQRARAAALGVELCEGDVADPARLSEALAGCRRVVHLASLAGVERVCAEPLATMRSVLAGSLGLIDACQRIGGIERLVLVSSSEVYGPLADRSAEEPVAVNLPPGPARWTYAAAKLAAEHLALAAGRELGFEVCVIRPFNVYGPGQLGQGAVRTFADQALAGQPLLLHGGGQAVRAWCHIDDLTAGLHAALFEPVAAGRIYNLGNPDAAVSVRALAEQMVALCDSKSPLVDGPPLPAEVGLRIPDIARARAELGFAPRVGLEPGLRHTLAWLRQPDRVAPPGSLPGEWP